MFQNDHLRSHVTENDKRLWRIVGLSMLHVCDYIATHKKCKLHGVGVECHTIARAVALAIPELKLVDGVVLGHSLTGKIPFRYHSWLVTPDKAIIDPYPCHHITIGPLLVSTEGEYKEFCSYRKRKVRVTHVTWSEIEPRSLILADLITMIMEKKKIK